MTKSSKRCWLTLVEAYDHTPTSPLVNVPSLAVMRVTPFTSTLSADPFARRVSVYQTPAWKPGMV